METSYYTPDISEFCEGFKYEFKRRDSDEWVVYDTPVFNIEEEDYCLFPDNRECFRVKHIDDKDLHGLCFDFVEKTSNKKYYKHSISGFKLEVSNGLKFSLFGNPPEYIFKNLTLQNIKELEFILIRTGIDMEYHPTKEEVETYGFICTKEFRTGEREFQKHYENGNFLSLTIEDSDILLELEVMTSANTHTASVVYEGTVIDRNHLCQILNMYRDTTGRA